MGVGEHWEKQKPRYIARGRTKEFNYTGEGFVKSKLSCEHADLVAHQFHFSVSRLGAKTQIYVGGGIQSFSLSTALKEEKMNII